MANKIIGTIAVVALILSGLTAIRLFAHVSPSTPVLGAVGGLYAENYDPYLRLNGGYNSALPIQTSSTLSAGATTISGITTLTKSTFCINFYATSTATVLHMVASTTGALPSGSGAVLTAAYGTCS